MKIITLIISVYILTLQAFPCTDVDIFSDASHTELKTASGNDHNHSNSDLCAPFCTCHCCHVHTIDFGAISFHPVNQEISATNTPYFDNSGDEVLRSFLDPPRV
ncbi:MAG: DUF6660 family protein [Salegentibacter sp.]